MGSTYDPLDYETWPDAQKEFAGRVWRGLHDGDLLPLAAYLRAGHYIEPALALEIADAIEGQDAGWFHIRPKGRSPGGRGMTDTFQDHERKMRVGVFMEDRLRTYGRGGYEAALCDTKERFAVKSSATIAKALKYVRDQMTSSSVAPGFDQWAHLRATYITP